MFNTGKRCRIEARDNCRRQRQRQPGQGFGSWLAGELFPKFPDDTACLDVEAKKWILNVSSCAFQLTAAFLNQQWVPDTKPADAPIQDVFNYGTHLLSLYNINHAKIIFHSGFDIGKNPKGVNYTPWQWAPELEPLTALGIGNPIGWAKGSMAPNASVEQMWYWILRQSLAWFLMKGGDPKEICDASAAPIPAGELNFVLGGLGFDAAYCWTPAAACTNCWAVDEIVAASSAAFQNGFGNVSQSDWYKFVVQMC